MTEPHEHDETPDQPDNADSHPENPGDPADKNAPDPDFLDRPISEFKDENLDDLWRKHDPKSYAKFQETARNALGSLFRKIDMPGINHVVDTSKFATALTADAWKSVAGIEPPRITSLIEPNMLAKFSGAYPDPSKWAVPGLAEHTADISAVFAPTVDMKKFYGPVIDAQKLLASNGALKLGEQFQRSLDKTYADIAKSFAGLGVIDSSLLKEAQRVSERYADLPGVNEDPLPYLEQFHSDFLVLYASLVLAAGHLENLVADLCEELLRKEQFHGASVAAQQQVGNMRETLEKQKKCTTCSELARQAKDPLKRRNLLVHGDWLVGEEIASDELKERHAWYWRISRTSRVTKRKLMKTEEMQALAAEWDAGKTKTLGDLFHSEVVSLGLVTAYVNKFAELNDKLEKELERHENEREKREANA
ncbi:hypothetical protein [Corynebacterium sp. DNF00584]|uniref:hypothetical protein n=1 Tax=Corynebacterium sp. DNF00584 TaxID=1384076 RepID=UPI00079C403E|nr:hypothetical protein [Corynebacterium sp. DNF00584]KXB54164.1 hypothetical protein HMPREF0307_01747 [Corynebacterium sp. DNF00584]